MSTMKIEDLKKAIDVAQKNVEAAHVAIRLPGPVRHHYLSLVRRRGKKVAIVAAARVLLELSWTLLHKGEVYRAA